MKLYEIANDYLALLQAIDEGEIPEEAIADTLEAIEGEIEFKADNLACVLKTLNAEVSAIKAEERHLQSVESKRKRQASALKTIFPTCYKDSTLTSLKPREIKSRSERVKA